MRILRYGIAVLIAIIVAAVGFAWWSQPGVIAGIEPPPRSAFDRALVEKGARLAAIGNCAVCHTAPGGAEYAGNRAIATPFGTIYSTNITPAPGSGIGRWSQAAFSRAMRRGISRRGRHLYPAFPYDHFARLSDEDIGALYAFVMSRNPVETHQRQNDLPFPLGQRWLLGFWNLLFLDTSPFRPDPRQSAAWNRGAYLVSGLGHCGACHTPRNLLGAEKPGHQLAGGEGESWVGPALNAASPAPVAWDAAHLFAYLRHGRDAEHGAAAGPMQPVVEDLAQADEADVQAIATYLAALQGDIPRAHRGRGAAAAERAAAGQAPPAGPGEELAAALFAGACAACHLGGPAMEPPRGIDLALSSAISSAEPRNAILILLDGISPGGERAGPVMPGFRQAFTDAQLAGLLRYLRAHYGTGPAWSDLEAKIARARRDTEPP